jgi:Uma2 family endonuclease
MIVADTLKNSIIEQLKINDLVRIPASEDDYFSVAFDLPFQVQYHDSEIITMGLASVRHEALAVTLMSILYNLLEENDDFMVLGSNSGVHIPRFEGGYYMPDALVIKGEPAFKGRSTAIITNPHIIIEILSPSTQDFDLTEKLPEYKHLESLQQVIFVSQKKMSISSYVRSDSPNVWLNQDFDKETDEVMIENRPVSLRQIYRKIKFDK